ncbi:MAG: nucleotide exchange factor GrpE [Oscillospiraceae bacterium]|nr:nucleotide exchange factor GrpE [Oscillospiraceae bacterium]
MDKSENQISEEITEENVEETEQAENNFEQQAAEATDKLLRVMAEFDNFKKRSQKEKEDLFVIVVCDVVAGFLPVLDNLNRAVAAGAESEDKSLLDGVKLVQKQFVDALTALGVEEIKTVGEEFNPELHNAVMHVEDDTVGANTIVEEFMKGYSYKGRVIRHSMVKSAN